MRTFKFGLIGVALAVLAACAPPEPLRLTILHNNDVHSRLQPVSAQNNNCSAQQLAQNQCFGGMARVATLIERERAAAAANGRQVLILDAGDQFQGSLFYSHYKGAAEAEVMNLIPYDAMALGNHEFDDGPEVLARFLRTVRLPVLSANVDSSAEPSLRGLYRSHIVVSRGGHRIAIIGATTEDTPTIASPGPSVTFPRAEPVLTPLIARLRGEGISHIVLLSHLGLSRDREVAAVVDGIDVIVGGHSHTLLSNTAPNAEGPYPVRVRAPSGREVPIVQAAAFTRFVGRIDLDFDAAGNVVRAEGDTIPVVQSIVPNPVIQAAIDRLDAPLVEVRARPVGASAAEYTLDGCRARECALGNLVGEAMLAATRQSGTQIALQNGGGLRAGIPAGSVTLGHVLTTLPFQNAVAMLKLRGSDFIAALENGLSQVEQTGGRFPQVAGVRYTWDRARPAGGRVVSVELRRPDGTFGPFDPNAIYTVATNDFMRRGGDGYTVLRDRGIDPYDFGPGLDDALADYMRNNNPVRIGLDGRIVTR
jgi:5'-nucleotidase / UDP-sugar diphosphatase